MYRLPCVSAVFIRCVCFKKKTEHFSSGHITKTKALVKYGGEQWKPMLRVSSIGKADMELCLPVPLQRKHVNVQMLEECLCSEQAEYVRACMCHMEYFASDGVCLCSARVATTNEQTHKRSRRWHSLSSSLLFDVQGYELQFPPINKLFTLTRSVM